MKNKGNIQNKGDKLSKKKSGLSISEEDRWSGIVEEIKAEIRKLPDVRLDKIQKIKKEIDSGNYEINSLKIARRILEEI